MEESGHYYTIYFTSLAVGFKKNVAYKQAVFAQMPDEVGWLDAANLHTDYCLNSKETNLENRNVRVPNEWRFLVETAIHSLTGGSSDKQRFQTRDLLLKNRADSLEFGLLLHRLGDTYAHSIMGNENYLYKVEEDTVCFNPSDMGHFLHGHSPDYPYLRQKLFFTYLRDVYKILETKADSERVINNNPTSSLIDRDAKRLSLDELISIYSHSFAHNVRASMEMGLRDNLTVYFFINDIRRACLRYLGVEMEPYKPENEDLMSLSTFLAKHPEIASSVSRTQLINAINKIIKELM
jgi:hypothetical protein